VSSQSGSLDGRRAAIAERRGEVRERGRLRVHVPAPLRVHPRSGKKVEDRHLPGTAGGGPQRLTVFSSREAFILDAE